jgi:Transposase DDE domain
VDAIRRVAAGIGDELKKRLPEQRKTQREKLALLVATMLEARTANLVEVATVLPLETERTDMRYQSISRFLSNELVDCEAIMAPFARDVMERMAGLGDTVVLILDQTKASDRHQILMLSVRFGERALPVAWRVAETAGAIGFAPQRTLLDQVTAWLPAGTAVMLMADRFYGTPDLIGWCQSRGWSYRIRLKDNLLVHADGATLTTGDCAASKQFYWPDIRLTGRRVPTNIGIIRDPGHAEPWIIAMSERPTYLATLEYSSRWGIEPMFSDFKSRGFGLQQTQIRFPDRLSRLILVMALALYSAVSTGLWDAVHHPNPAEKKP